MERSFRVVVFCGGDPKHILRLVIRIFREVQGGLEAARPFALPGLSPFELAKPAATQI